MDDNYYRQIRIVGFILDRLNFRYVNSAFISFSFTVWGGGLFQGGIAYGCLSKIFQECIGYGRRIVLRWSYFFALNLLFMAYLKKVRFDLTDFIMSEVSVGE